MRKITWTVGHPVFTGSVGPVELFRCVWRESAVYPGLPWTMTCSLPGRDGLRWRQETPAALRSRAEVVWIEWLRAATGLPIAPDEGLDDEPRPRLTDGHPHEAGLHPGWIGHNGHQVHRHDMVTGRTEWEKP